jgi:hypothetical protein
MVSGDAVGGRWVSHRDGSWALDRKLEPSADSTEAVAPGIGVKVSTSVLGQKQTWALAIPMSALPPKNGHRQLDRTGPKSAGSGHCIGFGAFVSPSGVFVVYDPTSRIR